MTDDGRPIGEEDLHAYVDDRLDPDRWQTVERYLQAHPEAGARIRRWEENSEALRQALAGRASEPIPASLSLPHLSTLRRRRPTSMRMAASVALALAGGTGAGWVMRGPSAPIGLTALAMEAESGHRATAYNHMPLEFAADRQADLVSWTSRQFGRPMPAPDLTQSGYHLLGGRIVLTVQGAGCLYLYDNGSGSRLTLFVRRMYGYDLDAPMQPFNGGDISGFAWARNGIGFSLVSGQSMPTLHEISDHIRGEMTGGV